MPVSRTDREGRQYWDREDPFPCLSWCGSQGHLRASLQSGRRCTLPGFRGNWGDPEPSDRARLSIWLGAPPDHESRDYRPAEPPEDGCPGGWARCRFAESLLRYRRARTEGGAHDMNPLVHHQTPTHILDALSYYEGQEAAAMAELNRKRYG